MTDLELPNQEQLKAFLYEGDKELCEIKERKVSDEVEHKYYMGSNIPIMSWRLFSMIVTSQPIIAPGVRHSVVDHFQDKSILVKLSHVSRSGSHFRVTGKQYE